MARAIDRKLTGNFIFTAGFTILAVSSSFSITLTEGGLLLAWLGLLLATGRPRRPSRWMGLDYLVVAFLLWELVTALHSQNPAVSLSAYRSEWVVLTYFLVAFGMHSVRRLARVVKLLAAVASPLAAYAVVQHFTGIDYIKHKELHAWRDTYKAVGLLGQHITFGVFYAWMFSISLSALIHISRGLKPKVWWTAATCLCAVAVLYSFSRAAWAGALAAVATLTVLKRLRVGYAVLVVVAVVAAAVILEPSITQRATTSPVGDMASKGDATRILLLRTSLAMIARYPVFGIGPGMFTVRFDEFKVPGEYSTTCHAHNDLVNFAVHSGLVGLALIGAILVSALRKGYSAYSSATAPSGRWLPGALLAGLVAIVVSGLFQCNLTDEEIAIQAWLIIGSIRLLKGHATVGPSGPAHQEP